MPDATSSDPLSFRRITRIDRTAFDRILEIYLDVFPASERKRPDVLWERLGEDGVFAFELTSGRQTVGMAIAHRLEGVDAVLLEYMGVRRDSWDQGLGQTLFRRITAAPDLSHLTFLLEVESVGGQDPGGERARRKAFYAGLGCREVEGMAYLMPRVGAAPPPPMNLLIYADPPLQHVRKQVIGRWLQAIYHQVYRRTDADADIALMLKDLPDAPRLI